MCQISDSGPGLRDPLADFATPGSGGLAGGHGLWVANQLCDPVEVATGRGGTDVRLYVRRPDAGG